MSFRRQSLLDRHRVRRLVRESVLTLGAVAGVVCILLAVASALFDIRPLVLRSGSMSPAIETGALAISKVTPAADLQLDDVVMVETADGSRVTHRIVTVTQRPDHATLALKGDANQQPDAQTYDVTSAARVLFDIPRAGYVVSALSGPVGLVALGAYVSFLLVVLFGGRRDEGRGSGATAGALVVLLIAGAGGGGVLASRATPTMAVWTDSVGVAGTTLTARIVPTPVASCERQSGNSIRLSWAPVSGATSYTVSHDNGDSSNTTTSSFDISTTSAERTARVRANLDFGSVVWTSPDSNVSRYRSGQGCLN